MPTIGAVGDQYILPKDEASQVKVFGQTEFLQLLISQLQNQDPTAPMENTEMVSQMTQFSTMESINLMSTSTQQSQTYNMIGKGIVGFKVDADTGVKTEIMGVVESAGISEGQSYVMVGDIKVLAKNVTQVYDQNALTGISDSISAATNMVGKYARVNLGTEAEPDYLEGPVERWQLRSGIVTLTVNGTDVLLGQISAVADNLKGLGAAPPPPVIEKPTAPTQEDEEE